MGCCNFNDSQNIPVFPEYQKPFVPVPSSSCKGCADSWVTDNVVTFTPIDLFSPDKVISSKFTRADFR